MRLEIELNKAKTAIIGLVIIGVAWQYLGDPPTEVLMTIVTAISGLGGYEVRGQVQDMKASGTLRVGVPEVEWHKYYYRIIGYFLAFGGTGLVFDELIHGPLEFWPPVNHEVYGLVAAIIGLIFISIKPHGKE